MTGAPKLQGVGAAKIQEIVGQIRAGEIQQYVNGRALQNLGKRIVEEGRRIQENIMTPVKTIDWLNLYSFPTVWGGGRSVPRHENAKIYDWACPEEVEDINVEARRQIENNGGEVIINKNNVEKSNLFTDAEGRYWVAVGPRVLNSEIDLTKELLAVDFLYGTKIDIHVQDKEGNEFYIPAVVGDIKQHSGPEGLYQTGISIPDGIRASENVDFSTVEFMGKDIFRDEENRSAVNITNDYELIDIIVYDNMTNYAQEETE